MKNFFFGLITLSIPFPLYSMNDSGHDVATFLEKQSYRNFCLMNNGIRMDSLWTEEGMPGTIGLILLDDSASWKARFFAAEIVFYETDTIPEGISRKKLAGIYAQALKNNYSHSPNYWGQPDHFDGNIGNHVLSIGRDIIPVFRPLLTNRQKVEYSGSHEATTGKLYGFEVRDIAAMLIREVQGKEYSPSYYMFIRNFQVFMIRCFGRRK